MDSAFAQGLRVDPAPTTTSVLVERCISAAGHGADHRLAAEPCSRLERLLNSRPQDYRRPTPAWTSSFDSLMVDALAALGLREVQPVYRSVAAGLAAVALDPGMLRWRHFDLLTTYRALAKLSVGPDAPPWVRQSCVDLGVSARDYPLVRECARQALGQGEDSTWYLLRLAWLETHRGSAGYVPLLIETAVASATSPISRRTIDSHLRAAFDRSSEVNTGGRGTTPASALMHREDEDPSAPDSPFEVIGWLGDWLSASEYWGGAFYGCPYFIARGGLGTTNCDRTQLPPARTNVTQVRILQLPIAEFWDPMSGEERVAIAGLPIGPGRTGLGGVLRLWSGTTAVDGRLTVLPLEEVKSAAAGRVAVAAGPRGVRAWFFDAGELESGKSWVTGVDDADGGRARDECVSDLFLVPSDDPGLGLGSGWAGKVPFTNVLRRHQPAIIGMQYRRADLVAQAVVGGRITITSLQGQRGTVSMSVTGEPTGAIGEVSVGLDIATLSPGRYRASIAASVPGCPGEQQASRDFRVVE